MNWLRLISFGWLGNSAEPKALPPREAETTDWTRALAPRESIETAGPEGLGRASQMARMKRGVGYCENTECEDYAKGVFLLNHGDTFYCPRCRQLGKVEKALVKKLEKALGEAARESLPRAVEEEAGDVSTLTKETQRRIHSAIRRRAVRKAFGLSALTLLGD